MTKIQNKDILYYFQTMTKLVRLFWTSYKTNRVTRCVLGSEFMAFSDSLAMFHTTKIDLEAVYNKRVLLLMYTDSRALFDFLTKASMKCEKSHGRLKIR